ncbi:MAG TPA: coenzyme F420-0:L-glutamate ligase [Polyangiales bacterium]|nr:coenzyme F420-0:L-glutamate ligase [Polyangiales bacterium]
MDAEVTHSLVCAEELSLRALRRLPQVTTGADLGALIDAALRAEDLDLWDHDVLVVCSKVIAKAEGRYLDLSSLTPSAAALELAAKSGKDPQMVQAILQDSSHVSRVAGDVLVVRHNTGHVSANAGLDQSNVSPPNAAGNGPWVLRLPEDPDASAERLRAQLSAAWNVRLGVVVSDSFGRPFRQGTVGTAIGCAGLPPLYDQRGRPDMFGRVLEHTLSATADQVAAAADLVAGQADEARPVVRVRGLRFAESAAGARVLCRKPEEDLYL